MQNVDGSDSFMMRSASWLSVNLCDLKMGLDFGGKRGCWKGKELYFG